MFSFQVFLLKKQVKYILDPKNTRICGEIISINGITKSLNLF